MLKAVIFDFDGVLVDSERAHFEGFRQVLAADAGFEITFDEYTDHYLAYDDHGGIRRALERNGRPAGPDAIDRLARRKKSVFAELLPRIGFLPGAIELIEALAERRVPIAIASGARRREIEGLLDARNLRGRFRGIVSADDVDNFKPHPEPYLRAREFVDAGGSPDGVLAFEDSPAGMASARAADLRVVGVTNSYPRSKLGLAHDIVDSLADVDLERLTTIAGSRP